MDVCLAVFRAVQQLSIPPTLCSERPCSWDLAHVAEVGALKAVAGLVASMYPWTETEEGWAFDPPRYAIPAVQDMRIKL
jgi:hypothetical protein